MIRLVDLGRPDTLDDWREMQPWAATTELANMNAWGIYAAAKRHKYVIALCMVLATAAAIMASLFLPRFYTSTAILMPSERAIHKTVQGPTDNPEAGGAAASRETRIADLVVLGKSRSIAERVSRRVNTSPQALMMLVDVDTIYKAGGTSTDLIRVSVRAKDPGTAVTVANAWSDQYIKFYDEVSHREAVQTREFLDDLADRAKRQLDLAQADLGVFRRQNGIADLPSQVSSSLGELAPLRAERDGLRARLSEIDARLSMRKVQLATLSPTRQVMAQEPPTAIIEALRRSIADANAELIKLSQTYTSEFYRVKELRQQIAAAQIELNRQLRRSDTVTKFVDDPSYGRVMADLSDLQADTSAGKARLQRLETLISERQAKLSTFSDLDLQLSAKRRVYDEVEKRYTSLVAQANSARINERISTETGAIKLVDPARSAEGPTHLGPSAGQLIPASMLLGLLLGLGVAVAVETLDKRIRTATDASDLLELPVTGIIPSIPPTGSSGPVPALVTQNAPMSPYAESYRFLATEVLLDAPPRDVRSIMIATAKPGQGGTSTVCNLAITLAQAGRKVVLVDADLRRPGLHRVFGTDNDYGLAELLGNGADVGKALKPTFVENLSVVTGGSDIVNPWALLRSARMPQIIDELKLVADYVLVDTPSAIVFADAATLASVVDGVIVVVRANESPRGTELQIKGILNHANANILGVVLNDVPATNVDSCMFYDHYYSRPIPPPAIRGTLLSREGEEIGWSIEEPHSGNESGKPKN